MKKVQCKEAMNPQFVQISVFGSYKFHSLLQENQKYLKYIQFILKIY